MAEIDYDLLARKVAEILKNNSQGVGEEPEVANLEDVYSLPANKKRPNAEDKYKVVIVPIKQLQQPALDAADIANTAADNADAKATLANNAANLANEKAALADAAANSVDESKQAALDAARDANVAKDAAVAATTDLRELESTVEANEDSRKTAESARTSAEQGRQTAEAERETKEAERIASETVRVAAETERNTAETARQSAEALRQTAEEKRDSDFNDMQSSSEIATGAANAAAASANQAAITANTAADNADAKAELAQEKADYANEVASHQPYPDVYGNWWVWDPHIKDYIQTDVNLMGKPWTITKKYPSKEAMEADVNNPKVPEGAFVTITVPLSDGEGADVNKPDTAAVYLKTKDSEGNFIYSFFTDFSGAQGFEGKTPMFRPGTMTVGEAGSQVKMTLSPDGEDSDGNPIYKMNFTIPRGNPGAPFQVKGQYATLEELQAAIPDGSTVEGFIAVGDKIPFDYYAWVNGAWVNQGKIVGEGGGKMVIIPSDIIELTSTSTSNEILNAFGGKEAFIDIVTKVKEGAPAALDAGGPLVPLSMFEGRIDESINEYLLNIVIVTPALQGTQSPMFGITLRGDVASLERDDNFYDYANVVYIPLNVIFLTSDSTSEQIVTAFGGKENFDKIVDKVGIGSAINTISGGISGMAYSMSATVVLEEYTDANNLSLEIAYSVAEYWNTFSIKVSNGIFSCESNQIEMLKADWLVSDPSTGGTGRPASAEAVKVLNDTKVSSTNIRSIQQLSQAEYDALSSKDNDTLYIII